MRFPNHVSIARDIATMFDYAPMGCLGVHDHVVLVASPAGPVPVPQPRVPSLEIPVTILWPPGYACGVNRLTSTVYHNNLWIALREHDCGPNILHLCLAAPPPCIVFPKHIIDSSRKAKFDAGEVKANGRGIACCTMFDLAVVPTPMMVCGSVPLPAAGTGTAVLFNSLIVGMHLVDLLAGWADTLISILQTVLSSSVELGKLMAMPSPLPKERLVPEFGSLVAGLIRFAGQAGGSYHGDAWLEYKPLRGLLGQVKISVRRDGASGSVTGGVEGRAGTRTSNVHAGVHHTRTNTGSGLHDDVGVSTPVWEGEANFVEPTSASGPARAGEWDASSDGAPWPPMTGNPFRGMGGLSGLDGKTDGSRDTGFIDELGGLFSDL